MRSIKPASMYCQAGDLRKIAQIRHLPRVVEVGGSRPLERMDDVVSPSPFEVVEAPDFVLAADLPAAPDERQYDVAMSVSPEALDLALAEARRLLTQKVGIAVKGSARTEARGRKIAETVEQPVVATKRIIETEKADSARPMSHEEKLRDAERRVQQRRALRARAEHLHRLKIEE